MLLSTFSINDFYSKLMFIIQIAYLLSLFIRMIELSSQQQSDKMDIKSSLLTFEKTMFRNCSVHYYHMKRQIFHKIQNWKMIIKSLGKQRQGYQTTYVLTFLCNLQEQNGQHFVSQKQISYITKQIIDLFEVERNRILREKCNQYQMIAQRNNNILRELNRLNQLKGPLNPQRLLGLDIFSYLLELNEKFKRSKPEICRLIGVKTIVQITKIQQIGSIEASLKSKWEENYAFLDNYIQESTLGMLSEILFLSHIKRRIQKFQQKNDTSFDVHQISFQAFKPEQRYIFKNSDRFKYKFFQLVGFYTRENNLQRKNYIQKGQLNRKIDIIIKQSQYSDQRLELRALMVQYRLTFKSLSQLVNNLQNGISLFPRSQLIVEQLKKIQWSLLKSDRIETNFHISGRKNKNDPLDVLTVQNFIGQSICKIALERFREYATVLKIQNKLMKKIDKGTSLYIRKFNYSYQYYYSFHNHMDPQQISGQLQRQRLERINIKEQNDSQQIKITNDKKYKERKIEDKQGEQQQIQQKNQKKICRKQQIITVILGFSKRKIQFAFKYDEQLSQINYVEHLVKFLKTERETLYNVYLSELDFERNILSERTIARMVQSFRQNFNKFVKFQASPSKYFYHLLVHTYVDKYLSETRFKTIAQFSEILSLSLLQIIKIINFQLQGDNIENDCQGEKEQSQYELVDGVSQQSSFYNSQQFIQLSQWHYTYQYNQKAIDEKIRKIMKKRQSILPKELEDINWQGKTTFLKKNLYCLYYFFSLDQGFFETNAYSCHSQSEIIDLSSRFLKYFKKSWPFLTDLQISNKIKNLTSFVQQKGTNLIKIKRLLRNITKKLIIYQAYFNQLFCSKSKITKNSNKQTHYLGLIYRHQIQNIEKIFPNQLECFFIKLLKDFAIFPVTSKMIRSYYNTPTKKNAGSEILKAQHKEQQDNLELSERLK